MANILVVDDEEAIRRLLSRVLSRGGYECTLAADAAEARKFIKGRNFELILCDVAMPGESGIDFIRHVAAEYPDTAIMMMTEVNDPTEIWTRGDSSLRSSIMSSVRFLIN